MRDRTRRTDHRDTHPSGHYIHPPLPNVPSADNEARLFEDGDEEDMDHPKRSFGGERKKFSSVRAEEIGFEMCSAGGGEGVSRYLPSKMSFCIMDRRTVGTFIVATRHLEQDHSGCRLSIGNDRFPSHPISPTIKKVRD